MSHKQKTMRSYLYIRLILLTLVILLLLVGSNIYAVNLVRNQVARSSMITVNLHLTLIENELSNVELYLSSMLAGNADLAQLSGNIEGDERHFARVRFLNNITKDSLNYKPMGNFFIYDTLEEHYYAIERGNANLYISEEYRNLLYKPGHSSCWNIIRVDQEYYFYRFFASGNIYIGAWVAVENLLDIIDIDSFTEEALALFASRSGEALTSEAFVASNNTELIWAQQDHYLTGDPNRYLVVGQASQKGDFQLLLMVPDRIILAELPQILMIIILFSVVLILLAPYVMIIFRQTVMRPVGLLVDAMNRIKQGDINSRIDVPAKFSEFGMVQDQFNDMAQEIQHLKISVYEEQLALQKAELEHMQLQINPHFFLNTLNIIYGFAQTKNYRLIQELTLSLVRYFRYVFDANSSVMLLEKEIDHATNYLHIQEMRLPGHFTYEIRCPASLKRCYIPTLLIHTFIENAIKYASGNGDELYIVVDVALTTDERRPTVPVLQVVIRDNGIGFNASDLAKLNRGEQIVDERGRHIGIWNAQRRLSLLYQEYASIQIRNGKDGGAIITIHLPHQKDVDAKGVSGSCSC